MSTLKSAIQLISPQLGTCPILTACNVLSNTWQRRFLGRRHELLSVILPK